MEKVLHFLHELSENNNKEWFHANRKMYEESRDKILFITEILINEIRKFDSEIPLLNPKDCVFRIFRDVRFSKDKRPYKTNFGSFIAKGGRKSMHAGYYFHIKPGGCFVGGGIYMPPPEPLRAIRSFLSENGEEFLQITNEKAFKKTFPEMYDDKLKTTPKGFPKNHQFIQLLRYKSFIFSTTLQNEIVISNFFINHILLTFKQLRKINRFLNKAVDKKD